MLLNVAISAAAQSLGPSTGSSWLVDFAAVCVGLHVWYLTYLVCDRKGW